MTESERPLPPTVPTTVTARRVLVLAPHYDDEVLGCGGLLLQLAASGAHVTCAFLSDGSGGVEGPPEGQTRSRYAEIRRAEGDAAAAALGVTRVEHLGQRYGLPDGGLASTLDALAGHVGALLEAHRPDLVLTPSPLEATGDHQATFRALHEALIARRRRAAAADGESSASQDDDAAAGEPPLQVLCYEVNHPFYPDLLVDVTAEEDRIAAAMGHYRSQLARHDYLAACIGLRRFRTHSLGEACRAAEGYCGLTANDFTTRSPARLIAHLGGVPALVAVDAPRRVSIIVRTLNRPGRLTEALESLAASVYRNVELVLVNDGGRRPDVSADFPFAVRRVELARNRGRAAAAQAGVERSTGDCIGFLDDDDLFMPEHLESLVAMLQGDVEVAYSDAAVVVYEAGPRGWKEQARRRPYSRDFDRGILLLDNYIPFHTLLFDRAALERAGPFDEELPVFEDWDLLLRLSRSTSFVHLARVTCEYRHFVDGGPGRGEGSGHALGGAASGRDDFIKWKARVMSKHSDELRPATLASAVATLRRDAVVAGEAARAEIREREREVLAAQGGIGDRDRELRRLYEREQELVGEIEAMKATRTWRLHERLHSWRDSG